MGPRFPGRIAIRAEHRLKAAAGLWGSALGIAVCLVVLLACRPGATQAEEPAVGEAPQDVATRFTRQPTDLRVHSWIEGLEAPWSLVFLAPGRALVSERAGRIRLIRDGELVEEPYARLDVHAAGEGGLMGLALHPDFPDTPFIYAMYTHQSGDKLVNRVQRLRHRGESAEPGRVVVDDIPGGRYHNGGRIGFGPDGMLYVTTGETFRASLAQDRDTLAGCILRVAPDGSVPADNPFPGSPVWSFGHRNPQGLAWHPQTGDLFASEHGPSGEFGLQGHDIINRIRKGVNFGWPMEVGAAGLEEYADPLLMWEETTPPSGMTFWRGDLWVATLRSEALMRIRLESEDGGYRVRRIRGLFAPERGSGIYGRLRAAVSGPDGALYVLTSNRDGRGTPREGDDRILRITPSEK